MIVPSSTDQREVLALSFEPADGGYVYYHYRWSAGVPVTAEEREAYLRIPALGSRRAWRKSLSGRQSLPPRPYKPVQRKLLASMPVSMAVVALLFGVFGVLSGFAEPSPVLKVIYVGGGCAAFLFVGRS